MKRSAVGFIGCVFAAMLSAAVANAQTIAYDVPPQAGNQTFAGNLGLDFDVNTPIFVKSLGAFDNNGDGFTGTITVAIFNRDTQTQVGPAATFTGTGATLVNGSRFSGPINLYLPAGHYSVVAIGFNATDRNGNSTLGGAFTLSTENTGGGAISFVGNGRFDGNVTLDYPLLVPAGAPTNVFLAGTFVFAAASDVYQVRYSSNLSVGDSVVNIINTGASATGAISATGTTAANGNLCYNVYTFSPDEQLISCCSCFATPNSLVSLSARNDLISNTLTPGVPTSIVIKLVATTATNAASCNAATAGTGTNALSTGMAAYGTSIHLFPVTPGLATAGTYAVTETPFTGATLSGSELARVTSLCGFIQSNGSGFGICKSCRFGGLGASAQ